MDKKPLIGVSLCAVVLLVLGPLSNVVGHPSVKPTTVSDSPLFKTRTQRATNQKQNIVISKYLGMGKEKLLYFPIRDNKIEQLEKVIDIISKMGDKTFAQFIELCIQKARQNNTLHEISNYQIVQVLHLLKTEPERVITTVFNRNHQNITSSGWTLCDLKECIITLILYLLFTPLIWIVFIALCILDLFFPTIEAVSCDSRCLICGHEP